MVSSARPRPRGWLAVLLLALALVGTACDGGTPSTRAGGEGEPIRLRLGTDDGPGRPGSLQVEEFARQVAELSDGGMIIDPVWHAAGQSVDDWDQLVARQVVSSDLDLGMVPTRAWDTEGVTTLQALNTPFLITSNAHVADVLTSDLVPDLIAGLEDVGVVALALFPEGQRHLFLFGDPPPTLDQLPGKTVRVPRSRTVYAFIEALGMTPDDFGGEDARLEAGVADGSVAAAESSFALAGTLVQTTTAIGNVSLFPKVNSLVVNADVLASLDEGQRQILRDAAAAAARWALEMLPSEEDAAEEYCRNGGRVLHDDSLDDAMQAAAATVRNTLDDDPTTAALIDAIAGLPGAIQALPEISACEPYAVSEPEGGHS